MKPDSSSSLFLSYLYNSFFLYWVVGASLDPPRHGEAVVYTKLLTKVFSKKIGSLDFFSKELFPYI